MPFARSTVELQAANGALAHLGEPPLASLAETRNAARQIVHHFADVRDSLLAEHDWNFARDTERPAAEAPLTDPIRYPLADTVIQVLGVDGLETDDWQVVAAGDGSLKVLTCGAEAPLVHVIRRIDSVAQWSPLFLEVFQLRLAARLAPVIARNARMGADLMAMADSRLMKARRRDAQEGARKQVRRDGSWMQARLRGSAAGYGRV